MSSPSQDDHPESVYELGNLVEDFSVSRRDLIFITLALPIAAVGISVFFFLKILPVLPPVPWAAALGVVACGGIGLAVAFEGLKTWRTAHARKDMRVLVFDNGIVSFRPDGAFTCRWDEVEWTKELFAEPNHPHGKNCTVLEGLAVHCRTGREWILDRRTELLRGSLRLAAMIQLQVAQRMLPQALADLRKGATLDFGAVQLNLLGIAHENRLLSWADLKAVAPHGFGIQIQRRGAWRIWATIVARNLVNKYLLLAVAETMRVEQRE